MGKYSSVVEFGAGSAIGTLLGLIMGLSASPVVSVVLGTLATGLLALLGFAQKSSSTGEIQIPSHNSLRVFGFGLFCAAFLLVGVLFRTYDALAPSLSAQEQKLSSCKTLSAPDVRQILLLRAFGLIANGGAKGPNSLELAKGNTIAGGSIPYLFAGSQEICQVLKRDQYKDVGSYLQALQVHGGEFAKLAALIGRKSPQDQEETSVTLSNMLCK